MNQNKQVLDYMETVGAITPREAAQAFGCTRLSARIGELKEQGHPIKTEMIPLKNRYGKIVRVAKYSLPPIVSVRYEQEELI